MKTRNALAISLTCLMVAIPSHSQIEREPAVTVLLNSTEQLATSKTNFSCTGRVYAHLAFPQIWNGKQKIEGVWIKPNDEEQERTEIEVDLNGSNQMAYLWLEFRENNLFDDIKLGDYGRGNEFDGEWTFIGFANGKQVASMPFKVQCP